MKITFTGSRKEKKDVVIDTLNSGSAVTFAMTYANIHGYSKAICEDAGWTLLRTIDNDFFIKKNNTK